MNFRKSEREGNPKGESEREGKIEREGRERERDKDEITREI